MRVYKQASAQEINIKSPLLNQTNHFQQKNNIIKGSKNNSDWFYQNNLSNINANENSNVHKNKPNSINLYKTILIENEINKSINESNNSSIKKSRYLQNNFKSEFKDLSDTFLSPYGGHVPRAPDESLKACKTQECYD